jgi:hypothetical protein
MQVGKRRLRLAAVRESRLEELEVHHRAREGARDPLDGLDLGYNKLPEIVDVVGACSNDYVIRSRYILRGVDAVDLSDFLRHLRCLAYFGLNQNVSLNLCHSKVLLCGARPVRFERSAGSLVHMGLRVEARFWGAGVEGQKVGFVQTSDDQGAEGAIDVA